MEIEDLVGRTIYAWCPCDSEPPAVAGFADAVNGICAGLELGQDPREAYVLKTRRWRQPPRLVLNARRTAFDMREADIQTEDRVAKENVTAVASAATWSPGILEDGFVGTVDSACAFSLLESPNGLR